jgi:hypothetical protein
MKQTKRDSISSRRQPNKKLSKNQRSPKAIKARELFQKGFSCSQAVFVLMRWKLDFRKRWLSS